jgi:hypothetical protein
MRLGILSLVGGLLLFEPVQGGPPPPSVDHHQHLYSQAVTQSTPGLQTIDAGELVTLLDRAGIRRAVMLSQA